MAFPDILIGSKFDAKGFKQAETAVSKLTKNVKSAAGALGLALSAKAAFDFGKASVKAFAEAEKANNRLAGVVDNLGLSFAKADIQGNLDAISAKAGIAGEELAAAYQPLLTSTGSVAKSQELLNLALDVAAGTGENLVTVTNDLSQAFVGNTKGLKKYNIGLTQAELKAASFSKIQGLLNDNFSGSESKYLETYAGKMQVLAEAAGNAQEVIGGGLIDAFKILAEDTSISNLATKMGTLAENTADFFRGLAQGFKDLAQMPVIKQLIQLAGLMLKIAGKVAGAFVDPFVKEGARSRSASLAPASANPHLAALSADANAKAAAKAEIAAKKRAQEIANATKKNTAELKKQALAKKQSALFDMEQIQIIAALKGNISKEEELRLKLQLASITGNEDQAKKLSDQLADSIDKTGKLKLYINTLPTAPNPFKAWDGFLDGIIAKARLAASMGGGANVKTFTPTDTTGLAPAVAAAVQGIDQSTLDALTAADEAMSAINAIDKFLAQFNASSAGQVVNKIEVSLDGKVVAESVQNQNNSGNYTGFSRLGDWRTP